jgi:hypothetical protein
MTFAIEVDMEFNKLASMKCFIKNKEETHTTEYFLMFEVTNPKMLQNAHGGGISVEKCSILW